MVNQITVFDGNDPMELADALLKDNSGLTITDVRFVGAPSAAGTFDGLDLGDVGPNSLRLEEGVLLTSGSADIPFENTLNTGSFSSSFSTDNETAGDADLNTVIEPLQFNLTRDAAVLEIDFETDDPATTSITFDVIFGSEEFPQFIDDFTDVAAAFVDGNNALLFDPAQADSVLSVTGSNVANGFFLNNGTPNTPPGAAVTDLPIEYNGVSYKLTVNAVLDPEADTHTLKIAIADTNDPALDSGIFASGLMAGTGDGGIEQIGSILAIEANESEIEGDDGLTPITFTVTRTGDVSTTTTVDFNSSFSAIRPVQVNDLDGSFMTPGVLTFIPGEVTKDITLNIEGDEIIEGNENFTVTLFNASNANSSPVTLAVPQGLGTIIDDDLPPAPPLEADIFGDPHLTTLDGLGYDFMAVGEFILVRSTDNMNPLEVQVRTAAINDAVSVNTAMATQVGDARITINVLEDDPLRIDGEVVTLDPSNGPMEVGDGEIFFDGKDYTIIYDNGDQVKVGMFDGFINVCAFLQNNRANEVEGLLGDADGDTANDLVVQGGATLSLPVDYDVLYGDFADSWRVTNGTSLFDYPEGQGTEDFTDDSFPRTNITLADLPAELVAAATQIVDDAGITDPILRDNTILDIALTGNLDFAAGTNALAATPTTDTDPANAPAPGKGIGITNTVGSRLEGDSGDRVFEFEVYRIGDTSEELEVNFTVNTVADDADGITAAEISSDLTGTVTFGVGEDQATIEVLVAGDETPEGNEDLTVDIGLDPGVTDVAVLSTGSTIEVGNDDGPLPSVFSIEQTDAPATEGTGPDSTFTYTITRSGSTLETDSVDVVVGAGADPSASADDFEGDAFPTFNVTFNPGEVFKTVDVVVNGDDLGENDEAFTVELQNAVGGTIDGDNDSVESVIVNDDNVEGGFILELTDEPAAEGTGDPSIFEFTVSREMTTGTATVDLVLSAADDPDSADANDFTGGNFPAVTLTFMDGEDTQTAMISVDGDDDVEADEIFNAKLENATGSTLIDTAEDEVVGTIVNDDTSYSIAGPAEPVEEGTGGGNDVVFTVTRQGVTTNTGTVTVTLSAGSGDTAEPEDFEDTPTEYPSVDVVFGPGETEADATFELDGDTDVENDEMVLATLSDPVGGTIETGQDQAEATIENDDVSFEISEVDAPDKEGDTGAVQFTYLVRRNGDTGGTDTVDYVVSPGETGDSAEEDDFAPGETLGETLTFSPGQVTQSVTVSVQGDEEIEDDETFIVELEDLSIGNIVAGAGIVQSTIINDDSQLKAEPDAFTMTEDGVLTGENVLDDNGDGPDFIPEGDTINVIERTGPANGDVTINLDGTFVYTPDENFFGTDTFTYEIFNIQGDTDTATVTITVEDVPVEFEVTDISAPFTDREGTDVNTPRVFTVTRTGDTNVAASVDYQVQGTGGDPVTADDFAGGVLPGGTLDFAAGETQKTVEIEVLGDSLDEDDEDFFISLDDPEAEIGAASISANAPLVETITDDDPADITGTPDKDKDEFFEGGVNYAGGDGNDKVEGSEESDQLRGEEGKDKLRGNGGNDILVGNSGKDKLEGGEGDDILDGGEEKDKLNGGPGDDDLTGGFGKDKLDGEEGDDTLIGGLDKDKLKGGEGNDVLDGGANKDKLDGGDGDDILIGGLDDDKLKGKGGNDLLDGGLGNDKLDGGDGMDTFVYGDGYGEDKIKDFDLEDDTLDVSGLSGVDDLDDLTAFLVSDGGNAEFDFGEGDTLKVKGLKVEDLELADIVF